MNTVTKDTTRPGKAATKIVTQFKPASDIEARRAFLEGAEAARKGDTWSTNDLKKLTKEGLIERLEMLHKNATLLRWRILAALRAKFDSDRLYGQYLDTIRTDPEYAHLIGKQQDMNRAALAGKWIEMHGITDLNEAGILISTVYALSRPQNADIQDKIYRAIRRKSVPIAEVERMIMEARSIPGQVVPEVTRIDYTQPQDEPVRHLRQTVEVQHGVVQLPEVLKQKDDAITDMLSAAFSNAEVAEQELKPADSEYLSQLGEKFKVVGVDYKAEEEERPVITVVWQRGMPDRRAATPELAQIEKLEAKIATLEGKLAAREPVAASEALTLETVSYEELILELSIRHHEVSDLTDQQRVSEMMMTDERFGLSPNQLIQLHQTVIKSYQKLIGIAK